MINPSSSFIDTNTKFLFKKNINLKKRLKNFFNNPNGNKRNFKKLTIFIYVIFFKKLVKSGQKSPFLYLWLLNKIILYF